MIGVSAGKIIYLTLALNDFMSRIDEIQRQIHNHNRRLQVLKEQQAIQGISVDPKIPLEIEDIETIIAVLKIELQDLKRGHETTITPANDQAINSSTHEYEKKHHSCAEITNTFSVALGLIVALFACIAAWLALPQIQQLLPVNETVELPLQQTPPTVIGTTGVPPSTPTTPLPTNQPSIAITPTLMPIGLGEERNGTIVSQEVDCYSFMTPRNILVTVSIQPVSSFGYLFYLQYSDGAELDRKSSPFGAGESITFEPEIDHDYTICVQGYDTGSKGSYSINVTSNE